MHRASSRPAGGDGGGTEAAGLAGESADGRAERLVPLLLQSRLCESG